MITGHRYDSGRRNTHGPCIADINPEHHPYAACEQPEDAHQYSEYTPGPGDMHEPPPYPTSHLHFE